MAKRKHKTVKQVIDAAGGLRAVAKRARLKETTAWGFVYAKAPRPATLDALIRGGCDPVELFRAFYPASFTKAEQQIRASMETETPTAQAV